jgi:GNAT superfamily N-acetyltransferase
MDTRKLLSWENGKASATDAPYVATFSAPVWSWESQVIPYPPSGPEGIGYFRGEVGDIPGYGTDLHVDCLLMRNRFGALIGILNHYPTDFPLEEAGNVLVLVHPSYRRQNVGRELWAEAVKRWNVTFDGQKFSVEGAAFANAITGRRTLAEVADLPHGHPDKVVRDGNA